MSVLSLAVHSYHNPAIQVIFLLKLGDLRSATISHSSIASYTSMLHSQTNMDNLIFC